MKMARSQLPPGALDAAPAGEDIDDRPTVEVKVHMMSVPMMAPMNPGSMPPVASVPADKANDRYDASSPSSAADKSNKPSSQTRFPGIFFKPKDKEKSTKKQKDENSKDKAKGLGKSTATVRAIAAVSPPVDEEKKFSSDDPQIRVSEADVARELDSLSAYFPEMMVAAPKDHSLKVLWDRMGDEEMGKKVSRLNRKLIEKELKRTNTKLRHLPTRSTKGKQVL